MELTQAQKLLIGYLKTFNVRKGMAAAIYMNVHESPLEMCRYISQHKDATEEELLDVAREIRAKLDAERQEDPEVEDWRYKDMSRQKDRKFIYATAANGLTVRIPLDRYAAWKAEQDKIRAGQSSADPQTVERLRSLMINSY